MFAVINFGIFGKLTRIGLGFDTEIRHVLTTIGVLTISTVSTFFIFPETAGRSLEEMSAIFETASIYNPYDVVRIEKRTPRRYDKSGNLLTAVGGSNEHGFGSDDDGAAQEKRGDGAARESSMRTVSE